MGSMLHCCLTGFLCRLCSGLHKKVIHIYGREGQILLLSQKINEYLPVTVCPSDQLPKTICLECKIKVDQHHQLIKMIKENSEKFKSRLTDYVDEASSSTTSLPENPPIDEEVEPSLSTNPEI